MNGVSSSHYRSVIDSAELDVKLLIKLYISKSISITELRKKIDVIINSIAKNIADRDIKDKLIESVKTTVKLGTKMYMPDTPKGLLPIIIALSKGDTIRPSNSIRLANYIKKTHMTGAINLLSESGIYIEKGQALQKWSKKYTKTVHEVYEELIALPFKPDYDINVSMRNIAEMNVRHEWHVNQLNKLKEEGINLVWINSHADCSERCAPYQGKLYSMDNSYGEIDGINYRPLSIATDIEYVSKRGKRYVNGCTSGFNCRHYLVPYVKGNKPVHVDSDTISKQRAITAKQRLCERTIRDNKLRYEFYREIDKVKACNIRDEIKQLVKQYKELSRSNERAYYPDRLS